MFIKLFRPLRDDTNNIQQSVIFKLRKKQQEQQQEQHKNVDNI